MVDFRMPKTLADAFMVDVAPDHAMKWLDKCAHCGYDAFVHPGPSGRKVRAEELLDGCAPSEGDGTHVVWQRQAGVESETRLQVCWRCGLPTPTFVRRGVVN